MAVAVAMVVVAAVVAALPVAVVAVVAVAILVAAHARQTRVSRAKILVTALNHPANRVRRKPHATAMSNSIRTRAVHAPNHEASHAMISTTSSPPVTPLRASRLPGSPQAEIAATSVADAPAAVRVGGVAGATGLVGRAVLARLLADKA